MISRIGLVCAIALVTYLLVPGAGALFVLKKWQRLIARFKQEKPVTGYCTGFRDGKLFMKTDSGENSEEKAINPGKTRFYIVRKTGDCETMPWKTVHTLQSGTTMALFSSGKAGTGEICMFHEEKNATELGKRLAGLAVPAYRPNPVKFYAIALGVFAEFLLFLRFIQAPDQSIASIAALVAIFGKALPYCPPGLFFTLASHLVVPAAVARDLGAKKNRQRYAAGVLLIATGIVLNIGAIFFVIGRIGF